jgi:uncharacterized membrane protein
MDKGRLEAFSDGVIAIIITIMVLEMKLPPPHLGATLADLKPVVPSFLSYALSYVFIGIYWNNHHHLFQATRRVTGGILWANLHLLFWLSLIPFTTAWMGENTFAPTPTAVYGVVLLLAALAYHVLQLSILRAPGGNPVLEEALGSDWKGKVSPVLYVLAIASSFASQWLACALYVLVALIWLIPDRRIERMFANRESDN